MPKYQPVYSHIWKDDCFPELSKDGKLLFLYLITNESINNSGIYQMTIRTISHETGIPTKVILQLLTNGSMKNVTYDQENNYVFIHKRRLYSPGGNPKQVQNGIKKEYEFSKHSFLWKIFDSLYPAILKGVSNGCPTVDQGLPNPSIPLPLPLPIGSNILLNNKTPLKIEKKFSGLIAKVLSVLNSETGGKFQAETETTVKLISFWAEKGHEFTDFETVILKKCSEWGSDEKMSRHLKPSVLFGKSHFKEYLEELGPNSKPEPAKEVKINKVLQPPGVDPEQTEKWAKCMNAIETTILPDNFTSLFEPMAFGGVANGNASLICGDKFHADCLAKNYTDLIEMTMTEIFEKPVKPEFVIEAKA